MGLRSRPGLLALSGVEMCDQDNKLIVDVGQLALTWPVNRLSLPTS